MAWGGRDRKRGERPPLDAAGLERLALFYVGRYATTRAKLTAYLARKIGERGWAGEGAAEVAAADVAERMTDAGYIDDLAFATARAAALGRRGFGRRRIGQALGAAGIGAEDRAEALDETLGEAGDEAAAWAAALEFARRRRLGPYAAEPAEGPAARRAVAALARAGHDSRIAWAIVRRRPGETDIATD